MKPTFKLLVLPACAMSAMVCAQTNSSYDASSRAASDPFAAEAKAARQAAREKETRDYALQADADLKAAQRDLIAAMRRSCANREAYLQIYAMSAAPERSLLKEVCASRTRAKRRK